MKQGDRVRVTTFVDVAPSDAFDVFTRETNLWWRRGRRYRVNPEPSSVLRFEPRFGGRLYETLEDGAEHVAGRVLAWEPGARLVFEWRAVNFAPSQRTEVEVLFEAMNGGTQVTLEHRGWAALPEDHPVRHGLGSGESFISMMGLWWGGLMTDYRQRSTELKSQRPSS